MSESFAQRLKAAAEAARELNARDSLPLDMSISPSYMETTANELEETA